MRFLHLLSLLSLAGWAACADGASTGTDEPAGACPLPTPAADFQYPPGPYGGEVGDTFEDFALRSCAGDEVRFADVLAGAELVLFNVGAGWCQPCIDETERLEEDITRPFCARGLRVVQVLFEDTAGRPATSLFCSQWTEQYGLSNTVLVDPLFITERYFDVARTPLNLLIDADGVIRARWTGIVVEELPERIDELLP